MKIKILHEIEKLIREKIVKKISFTLLQFRVNNAKYIHIMFNDKFNKPYVDFLNENFNQKEHLILCKNFFQGDAYPFPKGKNVIKIKNLKNLSFKSEKIKKIIVHSFFDREVIEHLYLNKELLKKSFWVIWSGDLYRLKDDEQSLYVKSNIGGYIGAIAGDEEVAAKKYNNLNAKKLHAPYCDRIKSDNLKAVKTEKKDCVRIQLNQRCHEKDLEMLDILSRFKDKNIRVRAILSYGFMEHKNKIIEKGKEIFGDKFEYLDEMISKDKYIKYLSQNDILIINTDSQQGVGNCTLCLGLGVKVFVKPTVTTWNYLTDLGFKLYDVGTIPNLSFSELIEYDSAAKQQNIETESYILDSDHAANCWKKVFESI